MLVMLKRHEVEILLKAGHAKTEVARLSGVSLRSVQRIAEESPVGMLMMQRSAPNDRCRTRTWRPPSWIASSSADALSTSRGPRDAPVA
jgi:hypothetical protein